MLSTLFLAFLATTRYVSAADANTWRSQSIYQIITDRFALANGSTTAPCDTGARAYCGGSWHGIIKQLDYIQGMGFTAIWISPITKNLDQPTGDGTSYHGYWQQDIYSLNPHFGTPSDLRALKSELKKRKMLLMVDIVVNHNGYAGAPNTVDYSVFNPFNKQSQYHSYCSVMNDNETSVEVCWLGDQVVPLVDLRTEDTDVATGYQTWIQQLVSNYSIDGLRIDTARQVNMDFLKPFNQKSGVFCTGEIFVSDANFACGYQNRLDSVLNYPVFGNLTAAFKSTSGDIGSLVNQINAVKNTCRDSNLLGSFSENHDNPRFASYTQDFALAKNIIAFTILADGIPIIYNGQEQHFDGGNDPYNRAAVWPSGYTRDSQLYKHVALLNKLRTHAITVDSGYTNYKNWIIYSDTTTIGMRKGSDGKQIITVLSNKGQNGASYPQTISNTGYDSNLALVEVIGCTNQNADGNGNIAVSMGQGAPKVFVPASLLSGSGICGR